MYRSDAETKLLTKTEDNGRVMIYFTPVYVDMLPKRNFSLLTLVR